MGRVDIIFNQIRPDTIAFWDTFFRVSRRPLLMLAYLSFALARHY